MVQLCPAVLMLFQGQVKLSHRGLPNFLAITTPSQLMLVIHLNSPTYSLRASCRCSNLSCRLSKLVSHCHANAEFYYMPVQQAAGMEPMIIKLQQPIMMMTQSLMSPAANGHATNPIIGHHTDTSTHHFTSTTTTTNRWSGYTCIKPSVKPENTTASNSNGGITKLQLDDQCGMCMF